MRTPYLLAMMLFMPTAIQAGTMYVSDNLVITLRSGQGNQYQILKMLPSGMKLNVVEQNEAGYARVVTPDGIEGWTRTQYLSDEPVAREQLTAIQSKLEKLTQQNKELKQELSELQKSSKEVSQERDSLDKEKEKLSKDIAHLNDVAARPAMLDRENSELRQKNVALEKDLQLLVQENQVLKDRSQREWFVVGALVLLGGMLIGFILPKLRTRRHSSW